MELSAARAWYEAAPAQPYRRRLCNVRWESAQRQEWGLLVPIADPRFVAEQSNLYFHRALVVNDEGGAVDGVIIEVVVKNQDLSAAALTALYERLFFNYQHHATESTGAFDGYAAYYNRENFYIDGATYTNGVKQAGPASLVFTFASSTAPTYDAHRGGYVTTICWLVGVEHYPYMEETWTSRTCYTYPSSGSGGTYSGEPGSSSGSSGGYPVGGGTTPGGSGGSGGSSSSPGSGGIPNDPIDDDQNGGYGGYNPNAANMLINQILFNNTALFGPCPQLTDEWLPLINYRPGGSSVPVVRLNNLSPQEKASVFNSTDYWQIQSIENAEGVAVNLDYFPVNITVMPFINGSNTRATPQEFLNCIRTNINSFVNTNYSYFSPHPALIGEDQRWLNNPLGSIISIDVPGPDDGSVIISDYTSSYWTFTTITDPWNNLHPVSGNRKFGFKASQNGYVFFTQGADRITNKAGNLIAEITAIAAGQPLQFMAADNLWISFQNKIKDFVDAHGGAATVGQSVANRPKWSKVDQAIKNNKSLTTVDCN